MVALDFEPEVTHQEWGSGSLWFPVQLLWSLCSLQRLLTLYTHEFVCLTTLHIEFRIFIIRSISCHSHNFMSWCYSHFYFTAEELEVQRC